MDVNNDQFPRKDNNEPRSDNGGGERTDNHYAGDLPREGHISHMDMDDSKDDHSLSNVNQSNIHSQSDDGIQTDSFNTEQTDNRMKESHFLSNDEKSDEVASNLYSHQDKLAATSEFTTREARQPDNNKRKRSWIVPLLLGVIIGILLVMIARPSILNPESQNILDQGGLTNKDGNVAGSHIVNVDVTTQVTDVVANVSPAVVGVTNIQIQSNFWQQQEGSESGTGSGVIYKTDDKYAYVVTNHHVIEGADAVEVVLADETNVEAEILGSDIFSDLAVLRMDVSHVGMPIEMGSSDGIKVGEPAIAIGNPLGHMFSGTVTYGVISGKQRTIPIDLNEDGRPDWQVEVIQTDAAINPGNSGGALINIDGQLIGINSMKINEAAVEGIGFAIPIDMAKPIIKELEETGEVTRAYLGVEIYSLEEVPQVEWSRTLHLPKEVEGGVYVWRVDRLSPAENGGLERLDVITALDGKDIEGTIDLRKILYQEKEVGEDLVVTYYRNGNKHETTIKLGMQP